MKVIIIVLFKSLTRSLSSIFHCRPYFLLTLRIVTRVILSALIVLIVIYIYLVD